MLVLLNHSHKISPLSVSFHFCFLILTRGIFFRQRIFLLVSLATVVFVCFYRITRERETKKCRKAGTTAGKSRERTDSIFTLMFLEGFSEMSFIAGYCKSSNKRPEFQRLHQED